MVMQSSTGQTNEQRLHPTHSSSLISGTGLPGTRARTKAMGGGIGQRDGLVGAVLAGDVAEVAADTFAVIDLGDALVVKIERFPSLDGIDGAAAEFVETLEALGVQIVVQAIDHVFDDAEAVVHDRGADLDVGRTESDELGRVAPGGDAADTGDRQTDLGIGGAGLHHVQRDRFHRRAAITAMRAESADERLGHEGVEIHLRDAVDRVDERDRIRAAAARGAGGGGDVGDVRS